LLGAGSNSGSDTQVVDGIAQGHAYGVLRVFGDGEHQLVQLQNPWGHGEWTGDWSDNSDKWTRRMRNRLGVDQAVDDGTFWMAVDDFVAHFRNIFICRLLPHRARVASAWSGATAAGPFEPLRNPHFALRVARPTTLFISLEQADVRSTPDKKFAFIMFFVFRNGARRVAKVERDAIIASANGGKFLNDREVTAELAITEPDTTLTLLATTRHPGHETLFTLSVFSTEPVELRALADDEGL
jgi:hypothetical protein